METEISKQANGKKRKKRDRFGALMEIWRFRLIIDIVILVPASLLTAFSEWMADSTGFTLTTANFGQILNWKFLVLFAAAVLLVLCYLVMEILSQIYLCADLMSGEKTGLFRELKKGFASVRRFLNPAGFFIIFYIAVLVPLCGIGFSISLTESFYIPRFITDVIFSKPLFTALYMAGIIFLIIFGFRSVFTLHGILLDHKKPGEARKQSYRLVREHKADFIRKAAGLLVLSAMIIFAAEFLRELVSSFFELTVGSELPAGYVIDFTDILSQEEQSLVMYRVGSALCLLAGEYIVFNVYLFVSANIICQLTRMYFFYTGRKGDFVFSGSGRRYFFNLLGFIGIPVLIVLTSFVLGVFYSYIPIFEEREPIPLTAHRTGGKMASENSLEGIDASCEHGVYGCETDIQRTKDGCYIINHDNDFGRLTGVARKPGSMTLAEIGELRIRDTTGSGALLPVPTMEELLDRGRGRVKLFLELKGVSADRKMADDIVAAVRERDMVDDVVLISLNYDVIDYAERTYPEFETGILIFGGFGILPKLNCDMIIMEEEMSTSLKIGEIHRAGKKAGVWTVNTEEALHRFLDSEADTVITDEILLAQEVQKELDERSDFKIMQDRLINVL